MKHLILLFSAVLVIFGCSSNNNGTVTVVPSAPTNLTGAVISTTQINLSWTDNATNEEGYKIERKTGAGNYVVVGSTSSNMTTFSDLGLTPSTSYTYRVYAYNSAGNSLQYSNEVTVTTALLPTLITTPISNTTATKTNDGNGTGIFISNLTGLIANTTYYVRAYATNANGTSYGNEVSFTTLNVDLVTGLVAYYPFNGNANDESGNGNNGTVNGGVSLSTDRFGASNKAYFFNGTSGYIDIPSLNNLNYTPISYSAWIIVNSYFPSSFGHKFRTIIGRNTEFVLNNGVIGFYADKNNNNGAYDNTLFMWRGGGQSGNVPSSIIQPTLNNWCHVVYTQKNNGDWSWFINGQQTSSGNFTNIQDDYNFFRIGGCNNNTGGGFWNDKLDDIRIYNRVLSATEVAYLAAH
ncbi:MAG: fibronectin type III domain-containing protein [Sphingobacteriales bacterium]|nr:fibronectin type III domain-containing protein [Sphingobacteriales bacterium]